MIDHISIPVRDLAASARFYEGVLGALGLKKLRDQAHTVGFGKAYPEFWLNARPDMPPVPQDGGLHFCLRASTTQAVDAFYKAALAAGGSSDGVPGMRPEYSASYYAAFVRDPDGNRIEAVTFVQPKP